MEPHVTDKFSIKIEGGIELKLTSLKDAAELTTLVQKNKDHLKEMNWPNKFKDLESTQKFIVENIPKWLKLESLHLSIRKDNILVGTVNFHDIDRQNHSCSLGYWLDKRFEKKGIMTKAVQVLIYYGFTSLKFHRIQILCLLNNHSSQRLAERLNFVKEGILKDAIFRNGVYHDAFLYAKIMS